MIVHNYDSPNRHHVTVTKPETTYEQFESEIKALTGRGYDQVRRFFYLNYSRGGGIMNQQYDGIVINSDESMALAIEYFGTASYGIRQGIEIYLRLNPK